MRLLYLAPPLVGALVVMAAMFGAIELAFWLSQRKKLTETADIPTVRSGLLPMIGLVLAFSFSIANARYELRRQLLVDEANALEITYLRAGFCSEAARDKLRGLLRTYVDARIEQAGLAVDSEQYHQVDVQREHLAHEMWSTVEAEYARDVHATSTATLVQSLNLALDLSVTRRAAHRNNMPNSVMVLIFVCAIVGGAAIGYRPDSHTVHRRFAAVYCVLVGLLFYAILDLDTSRSGLVRVPVRPLEEVRAAISSGH